MKDSDLLLSQQKKSGSRRRAEAALWLAAEAEGLPHSKTLRDLVARSN